VLLSSATAHADAAFDPKPDKGAHTWCYDSNFPSAYKTAADAAMTRLRAQTVVTTAYHSPCGTQTDVRWKLSTARDDYGWVTCDKLNASGYCDRWILNMNKPNIKGSAHPVAQRSQTACHELGHTLGVRHYARSGNSFEQEFPGSDSTHSCMVWGEVPGTSGDWYITYGHHHKTKHINPWFS